MSTQKAFREFERSWSQENLFHVQTKEKIARLEQALDDRDSQIKALRDMLRVQGDTIAGLEKDVHQYKLQVYDLSHGKGPRQSGHHAAHGHHPNHHGDLASQDDRRAAARRKRAQARVRQPQAGHLQPGSHASIRKIADPLAEQRKRKAAANDESVQRIEEMLKKLQAPREVDLVTGTSQAGSFTVAGTADTAPAAADAAGPDTAGLQASVVEHAKGNGGSLPPGARSPRSTHGSVAKLIIGNADARRSQDQPASGADAEDDLGVYDLEVIAARFPHMPLAFVLDCERKFIEADGDQSGLVDKSELATIISSSSLKDEQVNRIIGKHKLDTEHGLDFLDCLVIYEEISNQQKRQVPKRTNSRTRSGASSAPMESKACTIQ